MRPHIRLLEIPPYEIIYTKCWLGTLGLVFFYKQFRRLGRYQVGKRFAIRKHTCFLHHIKQRPHGFIGTFVDRYQRPGCLDDRRFELVGTVRSYCRCLCLGTAKHAAYYRGFAWLPQAYCQMKSRLYNQAALAARLRWLASSRRLRRRKFFGVTSSSSSSSIKSIHCSRLRSVYGVS